MTAYQYVKARPRKHMRRSLIISFVLLGCGGFVIVWAFWPILSFHLFESPILASVISPVGDTNTHQVGSMPYQQNIGYAKNQSFGGTAASALDLSNVNAWFPKSPQKRVVSNATAYSLSIPKLGITNAFVVVGGEDLTHTLVHYGGTALPGQNGNGVIFGHSVLPQFFNSKNYRTIFSTLPTLEIGDSLYITFDNVRYQYKVEKMTVTEPDDISVLDQQYDDAYISLVTCVPPGTLWQRLNVRARLVKI
jgi:sortase A